MASSKLESAFALGSHGSDDAANDGSPPLKTSARARDLALHKASLFNTTSYGYLKDYIQWATQNCFVAGSKVGAVPTSRRSAVAIRKVAGRNMIVQIRIMPSCAPR